MRRLRAPDGCPWDREQTHESLRPYLLEEAAEAVDAISSGEPADMAEELGDVLLQVAFHAVIAEESGAFGYEDVEGAIVSKLIRRHPHVFADTQVENSGEVVANWQQIKAAEKNARPKTSPAEQVPRSLPSLMRAQELGKKLGWPAGTPDTVQRALQDVDDTPDEPERAVGKLLLAVVDLARAQGVNPELALRDAMDARASGEESRAE